MCVIVSPCVTMRYLVSYYLSELFKPSTVWNSTAPFHLQSIYGKCTLSFFHLACSARFAFHSQTQAVCRLVKCLGFARSAFELAPMTLQRPSWRPSLKAPVSDGADLTTWDRLGGSISRHLSSPPDVSPLGLYGCPQIKLQLRERHTMTYLLYGLDVLIWELSFQMW